MKNDTCEIIFKSKKDLDQILAFSYGGRMQPFDFDKIIPQPKSINECPSEYIREDNDGTKDRPWFNEKEWNKAYWESSSNASDFERINSKTIIFSTNGDKACSILKEIAHKFPKAEFDQELFDNNGQCVFSQTYNPNGLHEE